MNAETDEGIHGAPAPDNAPTRLAEWRDRFTPVLAVVALPWALSRLLAAAVVLVAPSYPFGDGLRLTGFWYRWDGGIYVAIARDGYGLLDVPFPRWAFFPGLPGILRVLGTIGGNADTIGLFVINQLALLAALAGLFVLARRHVGRGAGVIAVWVLAFFPGGVRLLDGLSLRTVPRVHGVGVRARRGPPRPGGWGACRRPLRSSVRTG